MKDWIGFIFVFMAGAALIISIVGQWFVVIVPGINSWNRRFFRSYFLVLMLCCFFSLLESVLYYFPSKSETIYFILFPETLFLTLLFPMLTVYLLHCCREDLRQSRLLRMVLGLYAVHLVFVLIGPFIGWYYDITPDMRYSRKSFYPLLVIPVAMIMLLNLGGLMKWRNRLSPKLFRGFLIAMLPMTASVCVQLFVDAFPLLDFSIVISSLVMYGFILSNQVEQELTHHREIANQRASIMVLQMRPHFIYNTLTSIYCLCDQDPGRARQVIMDFTTYLRKNFTAIASAEPIPFSAELEHARAYLAVEQAQYKDSLFVEFDTPHTWFRVPPLTLQPIVENAIKHGRDPYAGPFCVTIRTRKTDQGSEIVVADNGRGLEAADDSEPHIALKNIEERLKLMCGGSLQMTPGVDGGTVVTVTVPNKPSE